MCFIINRYNLWESNARSGPSKTNVSASEALFVFFFFVFLKCFFFFFFGTTFVDRQIKINKTKAHKKVPEHA